MCLETESKIPHGYLRVTDVLKPFLDFSHIKPEVLAYAADRGTRVHLYCESYALGLFVQDVDYDCQNYVNVFKKWFDTIVQRVVHTEVRLNSVNYKLSGAFDMIAVLKGDIEPTLIDIKTPVVSSTSWQLQTAAYQMLIEECLEIRVHRRICLQLPKIGDIPKIVEYTDHKRDRERYLNALDLYRFFHP